ncbi:peptidase M61 [Altererythrobacter sp.]|nr:peptidase M61 [Altererythrobacter sp.]
MSANPVHIELTSDIRRVLTGVVENTASITFPPTDSLVLRLPKWLQHFHAPRVPVHEFAGLKVSCDEKPLRWTRDAEDVFAFHIECEEQINHLTLRFQQMTPTSNNHGRIVMGASMARLQWANFILYPAGFAPEEITVSARAILPDGWTADGALAQIDQAGSEVTFAEVDLTRFVDSPILCGEHCARVQFAKGVRAAIFADEAGQLPTVQEHIDVHARLVGEVDALFGGRPFDEYVFLLSLSNNLGTTGLEHRHSSENGVQGDYFTDWANSITERDLLPHEYIHAWCGKYRQPRGSAQADFGKPLTNEMMWVYEGFTQYYGHVISARCGLIGREGTMEAFAEIAATYDERAGRAWRPLDDTNNDPVVNSRQPQPWTSWQRSEDYYSEGAMIWLEVDMLIRKESRGEKSLDDFARSFFRPDDPEGRPKPYDFDELVAALDAIWSHDWASFLRDRTAKTADHAPLAGFEYGGYRLTWNERPTRWSLCDQHHHSYCDLLFSLGIKVGKFAQLMEVAWDSPAHDADLAIGAKILSLGGNEYSHDAMRTAVDGGQSDGSPIKLRVAQAGIERDVEIHWTGGNRHPGIERLAGAPDHLGNALRPRASASR